MNRSLSFSRVLLIVALSFLFAANAFGQQAGEYVEGQVIIKFKTSKASDISAVRSSLGAAVQSRFTRIQAELWDIRAMSVNEAVALYENDPRIEYIEPNYLWYEDATFPNDPRFADLWGLHNTGQTGGTPDADIDAPEGWDFETGADVFVGVIDTGTDRDHPDLAGNMYVNPGEIPNNGIDDDANGFIDDVNGWDFVNNDNNPFDDRGHGSHVAGTIGAVGNNGIGVVGVSWTVKMMPVKFLSSSGSGTTANAIKSVEYCTMMGVDLTNNSWGGGSYSQALKDAIDDAGAQGQLFLAAAGNGSRDTDIFPHYPSSYNSDNIISVANTTHTDGLSNLSNWGLTTVDLGAPGSSILSTEPNNTYGYKSGTSMATPHVAGAVSLLWSAAPALTHLEVKAMIMATVDVIPSLQGRTVTGGRLNVYNLLSSLQPLPDLTCHVPPGWDGSIVASSVPGTNVTDVLTGGEITYVDWAIINSGTADAGPFSVVLRSDGVMIGSWNVAGLAAGTLEVVEDYQFTFLSGAHVLSLHIDEANAVEESNENNNECQRTFVWNVPVCEPPAPGPVIASDADQCPTVTINWSNVPIETGYRIYRDGLLIDTKGPDVTMHTDFPPGPGPYQYCVEAFNACGTSARPCDSGGCIAIPECAVSRTSIDFGSVVVGNCADQSFDICNPVTATTNLIGTVSEPCDHYSILSGGGAYDLAPGQCRTVMVRFCPTAEGLLTCNVETGNPVCPDVFCTGVGSPPVGCVGPRVLVTDETGWNGQTVTIYVSLQESPWDIAAFALEVRYNYDVLAYLDNTPGDLTAGFNTLNANENEPGVITIGGFQPVSDPPIPMGSTGTVICLNFLVGGCTFGGQTTNLAPRNFDDDFIGIASCDGTFECVECVHDGDVNNSSSLSPGDAKCIFDIFLFGQTLPPDCDVPNWDCELIAADANCDGSVSPGDALCIFNRFLFVQPPLECACPFPTGPAASSASAGNPFDVPRDGIITVGDVIRVPVVMEATRGGAAFGFEVNFDSEKLRFEGITVNSVAEGWKALDANEVTPGRVIAGGFDPEGIKAKDVSLGGTIQIAELRFRKLSPDGTIGSIEWVEQRLDREAFEEPADTPDRVTKLDLGKPFPNPFRDAVSAYVMVPTGESRTVKVSVYDVKGRLVKTLLNQTVSGVETVSWDRRTTAGEPVSSGIYFMRMEVSETGFAQTQKLVVLR